jgi:hypothetical protein
VLCGYRLISGLCLQVPVCQCHPSLGDPSCSLLLDNFVNALRFPGSRAADHAERLRQ